MELNELLKTASSIVVGFTSAYFGFLFALKRFKKEKFWEERKEAYRIVIGAFEELGYWAEQVRANHYCEPTISVEAYPDEAFREISRYSETGEIMFSSEFHALLVKANGLIIQSKFNVHNESLECSETEQEHREWHVIQANEIREIAASYLPKLIKLVKIELPNQT